MRRVIFLVFLLLIASSVAGVTVESGARVPSSAGAAVGQQPPLAALVRREPDIRTEQEWLIQEILGTIAYEAWAAHAAPPMTMRVTVHTRAATPEALLDRALVDATVNDVSLAIDVSTHLWDPALYVSAARELLGPQPASAVVAATAAAPVESRSLAADLLDFRVETLLAADDRVSAALAQHRLDPAAHEDAALLVGALAWRERASRYSDVRRLLSRMTAELAVAAALQPGRVRSESGRLAALIISALAGREDLVDADLKTWPDDTRTPAARAWTRALRWRLVGDWRGVQIAADTSLLERLEYARTLRDRISASRLLAYYDEQVPPGLLGDRRADEPTDWQRAAIGTAYLYFSIEGGHRFATTAAEHELSEATAVWRHYHPGPSPTRATVIASLNDDPREDGRVLGWTTWSAALQRHLASALAASARFLSDLGDTAGREAWPSTVESEYGGLQLFPFVLREAASNAAQYHEAMRLSERAYLARPDLVTAGVSSLLRRQPHFQTPPELVPDDAPWFTPHEPTGTAFELGSRTLSEGCPRPVPLVHVETWALRAAHDAWVQKSVAWLRAPGEPAFDDVRRQLAGLLDYDLEAANSIMWDLHGAPEQVIPVAASMCRIDTDACGTLVDALVNDGRDEEAVTAGTAYVDGARDTVGLSHHTDWLVTYLWDTGRRARAAEIAAKVGDTGSASGLATLGHLLERQDKLDDAEAAFAAIAERYDDPAEITAYYLRRAGATRDEHWIARAQAVGRKIFPSGFERGEPGWLQAPPPDGVAVVGCGRRCRRYGLRVGDIIAAVDGRRVRTVWQYMAASKASLDPQMHFVIWRGAKYQAIDLVVPQRWFSVGLDTHPSTSMPAPK